MTPEETMIIIVWFLVGILVGMELHTRGFWSLSDKLNGGRGDGK